MKLPSIDFLLKEGIRSFRKFPLAILSAIIAVSVGLYLVGIDPSVVSLTLVNILLCGYLGVPLFISVKVFTDMVHSRESKLWLIRGLTLGMLILVYLSLPASEDTLNSSISYIRYTIFAVAAHLLVSFVGFVVKGSVDAFWSFNQSLFLRFLLSALYSVVLFIGLVLALFALDALFDLDVNGKRYFQIFIFIAGVFNTWFFVAGIPKVEASESNELETSSGLRTMLLYVLLPLITIYFIILYSYSAKVIFLWDWPKGIMTYMIIAMAVIGILTVLLSYPFAKQQSPLSFLSKWYYAILLPLLIMLLLAIGIRIEDYGVTINRYLTVLLAIWLLLISLYFVFRGTNMKVVPITLFAIILMTCFGSWGIFRVSEMSQVGRLEQILRGAELLKDQIVNEPEWITSDTAKLVLIQDKQNNGVLSDSLHNEVKSILDYLEDYHGFKEIDRWYTQNPRVIAEAHNVSEASVYMKMLGLEYRYIYNNEDRSQWSYFSSASSGNGIQKVSGYDYSVSINNNGFNNHNTDTQSSDLIPGFKVLCEPNSLMLSNGDSISLMINLNEKYLDLQEQNELNGHNLPNHKMTLVFDEEWITGELLLYTMSGNDSIERYSGNLLFRLR